MNVANPNYSSVDGVLFDKTQANLILYPDGRVGGYTIPDGVNAVGDYAFAYCPTLTEVTISGTVTNVGNDAFIDCTNLASVTLADGIANIGIFAFAFCRSLTNVTIPDTVTFVGPYAFMSCSSLTGVTIGNGITTIGIGVFNSCTNLTSVTIPNSVTAVENHAFSYCTSLANIYFSGNAPDLVGPFLFDGTTNATVYYLPGTTGWEATFAGRPTVLWNPTPQITTSADPFGFTITGSSDLVIVVEAATSLTTPNWAPVSTNTLTDGSSTFSDPQSLNHPTRFYRLRSP